MSRTSRIALNLAVGVLAAIPFIPSLTGGFLNWDDAANLLNHTAWRGLSPSHLRWMLTTTHMGPWQPLSWLTYALDYSLWGLDAYHFRLTNLLIHAATASLLAALLDALLTAGSPAASPTRRRLAAAGGALLWAVHPLRVEAVCWITERREVLSAAFYVLSLLLYVKRPGSGRPAWLAFVCACLAKGSALTLPLSLIVIDIYPLRRGMSTTIWKEKIPLFLVSAAVGAIGYLGQATDASLKDMSDAGPELRAALALHGLSFYAGKMIWPLNLSPFYGVPADFGLFTPIVLLSAAAMALAVSTAWKLRGQAPALCATLAHHIISLAPLIGLVRFGEHLAADRYMHLAGMGWAALASALLLHSPVIAAPLGITLGMLTWDQSKIWHSDLTLWTAAEIVGPPSRHGLVNLSAALRAVGKDDEAAAREAALLSSFPDVTEPRINYGGWLAARGRNAEALEILRIAPTTGPYAAKAHFNRALALIGLDRRREAIAELKAAVALDRNFAEAHNNLGLALLKLGDRNAAEGAFTRAALLKPDWAAPLFNRGLSQAQSGRLNEALSSFEAAATLTPEGGPAAINAAAVRRALSER